MKFTNALVVKLVDTKDLKSLPLAECSSSLPKAPHINETIFQRLLGRQHKHFQDCFDGKFIGVGFIPDVDLKNDLVDDWREFNKKFIPIYLKNNPST